MADVQAIVATAVSGLGYELVEFERTSRGLLRVYIDRAQGIGVDDCALVSNHLTRLFAVEGVDFDRLEVSSPGLDRALSREADFRRFVGSPAKVRLSEMVEGRKRFEGVIEAVEGDAVRFRLIEDSQPSPGMRRTAVQRKSAQTKAAEPRCLTVPLGAIEKARLIPVI